MDNQFAIIAVAYNREHSLTRLLGSIDNLINSQHLEVPLVISIDGGQNIKAQELASAYSWKFGNKRIILHEKNLGLENHLLSCMALSEEYGSVVILEDDCFISPFAFDFITQSLKFFHNAEEICGISLYTFDLNEFTKTPFVPLDDGYDNFFMKVPSSYGQIITKNIWREFYRSFRSGVCEVAKEDPLPDEVLSWSKSWKRYFFKYMQITGKYFLFPRTSITTNFCDAGVHFEKNDKRYQVNLLNGRKQYRFSNLAESRSTYDSYFELEARNVAELKYNNLQFDLYGLKNPAKYQNSVFITCKQSAATPEKSYGFEMWPQELNIIHEIPGDHFKVVQSGQIMHGEASTVELSSPAMAKLRHSAAVEELQRETEQRIKSTRTYRVGNAIAFIPRLLKNFLFKR